MTPYDEQQVIRFAIAARELVPDDFGRIGVNCARMQYDAMTMGYEASIAKHLAELRAEVNPPPRPSPARPLIRANFCGMRDGQGRIMFDPYWIALDDEERADWVARKQAAGLTHLVLCPVANYPGMAWNPVDLRAHPDVFATHVRRALDHGFFPIVMLTTGDGGSADDIDTYWPGLCAALAPLQDSLIVTPGFEVVGPGAGWTSAQLSKGLRTLKRLLPRALLGVHLQPERATGASYPLEADDPWQGDEAAFWRSHGGELADVFLYQSPHGTKLLQGDGWEDRWIEILDRLGVGGRGWRTVPCCWFETIAYDFCKGRASEADGTRLAARARELAEARGVTITFGNGVG